MKQDLICIICPRGCSLSVDINENDIKVSGNACKRGETYAVNECTNPLRTVTSSVRISNRDGMVSVKTSNPVSKKDIFEVMKAIRSSTVAAPVKIGDVILKDVCGSDIVATGEYI